MKILAINPNVLEPPVYPVGLEYTVEHLVQQGYDCSVLDMNVTSDLSPIAGYDVVMIAVRNLDSEAGNEMFELMRTRAVVQRIREHYSGRLAVAGSAVNLVPEGVRSYLGVDHALVSKGFGAVTRFLQTLAAGEEPPAVIEDFSQYIQGRFKRDVVDKSFYLDSGDRIGVATKFGCPFSCQYCDYPGVDGHRVIKRGTDELIYEIKSLRDQGMRRIFFCDAVFNVPVKPAVELLQAMLEADLLDVDWDGFINPHKAAFTREFAELMSKFGKTLVHFGVDSLSDPVLKEIRKGFTVADVAQAVEIAAELGMESSCSLLLGHPCETVETVKETFENVARIPFKDVDVSPRVRIYPAAPLLDVAKAEGVVREGDDLLEPVFYPVGDEVLATIEECAAASPVCRQADVVQYV